jgi:alkanesulfonate monooxygenase SsuD/methylene tetrahydromethanopterin reductase-like flavin-dependent oxidoreductase (luciferase family)
VSVRLGVTVPVEDRLAAPELLELARAAEGDGYDTVLAGEVAGPEAFALLAAIAGSTSATRVGSGIVPITTRSLPLLAMGFSTLASLAPGRVLAGVGVSSRTVVERWHGREFPPPLELVREWVPAFRRALSGERVDLSGGQLLVEGFRLELAPPAPVPVMLAAINPRMQRLAGALGDAVLLTWCPPDEVGAQVERVREGARAAGRDPAEVEIAASFFAYGGDLVEAARERYRRFVLAYALQGTHRAAFARSLPGLERADRMWRAGDRRAALAEVDDAGLDRLCAIGRAAVAERARALAAAGVDLPVLLPAGAEYGDLEGSGATIERLAADLRLDTKQTVGR